jgi:hypothetical protein
MVGAGADSLVHFACARAFQKSRLKELNTDFSIKGMTAQELTSVVSAWQNGALSRDSMLDLFRRGSPPRGPDQ